MPKQTFKAPDVEYSFDTHRIGYGSDSRIAVNVKFHGHIALDDKFKGMIAYIEAEFPRFEDHVRERAWESCRENWWDWARDNAKYNAVGKISSLGRQGGWLALDEWPPHRVEEYLQDIEFRCVHCDKTEDEHVSSSRQAKQNKCLLMSTYFEPVQRLNKDNKETLDGLVKYFEEIEKTVAGIGENLRHELELLINMKYQDLREQRGQECLDAECHETHT